MREFGQGLTALLLLCAVLVLLGSKAKGTSAAANGALRL